MFDFRKLVTKKKTKISKKTIFFIFFILQNIQENKIQLKLIKNHKILNYLIFI